MIQMRNGTNKRTRHRRDAGRRRARSPLGALGVLARIVDLCDTAIALLTVVGSPDLQSFIPLDPEPSFPSTIQRLRVSWRKAKRMATVDALPDAPWPEHRVGVILHGPKARHYLAARPSTAGTYDVLISQRRPRKGHCVLYRGEPPHVLTDATRQGTIRWLPVGIHADALTRDRFRRAVESPDPLTTLTHTRLDPTEASSSETEDLRGPTFHQAGPKVALNSPEKASR
jgi:hypothetical protein